MTYDTITTLKEINSGVPADAGAASELAASQRQIRAFLKSYLATAHNDDGTLRDNAVGAGQVGAASVGTESIQDAAVTGVKVQSGAIDSNHLATNAVTNDALGLDAVKAENIDDGAVGTAALAADAVTNEKVANDAINSDQIVAGAVTNAKVASGLDASKLLQASGGATFFDAPTGLAVGEVALPACLSTGNEGSNKVAKIGGVLTATLNIGSTPPEIVFAFASGSVSTGNTAIFEQRGGGTLALAASTEADREDWAVVGSTSLATVQGTNLEQFNVAIAGNYMIYFSTAGYSCDQHQARLYHNPGGLGFSLVARGNLAASPPGAQTVSSGWYTVTLAVGDLLEVRCIATTASTYGQGYAGSLTARFGHLVLLKLS